MISYIKSLIFVLFFFIVLAVLNPTLASAAEPEITISNGYDIKYLTDHSYYTNLELPGGTIIRIENASEVHSLYLEWDLGSNPNNKSYVNSRWYNGKPGVKPWTLRLDNISYVYGTNGFLHEYIELPSRSDVLEIIIPEGGASIAGLSPLTGETLPDWVQVWEPPHDKADLLVLSSHSDDEILFFGGTIPYYTSEIGLKTQVVYFTYHTEKCRTHELLNSLYYCGVRNYPIIGNHEDIYSSSLAHAKGLFNYNNALGFIVELYRRFQPNVLVTHDLNGEYGHGVHCLVADLATKALELSNDPTAYPDSFRRYGLWDVKKAYLHLYAENPIDMEWEMDLASYGGMNIWDVIRNAMNQYDSQLKYYGESLTRNPNKVYDCTRFGLYRSTVGFDTGLCDFFENIPQGCYKFSLPLPVIKPAAYAEAPCSKTITMSNYITKTQLQNPKGETQ